MDRSGIADLAIDTYPRPERRRFMVSADQWAALEETVATEQFFRLADEYGERVFDSSTTVIRVNVGGHEKAVTLHFLGNWLYNDPKRLREPARALRVLRVVRGWPGDDDAARADRWIALVLAAVDGLK